MNGRIRTAAKARAVPGVGALALLAGWALASCGGAEQGTVPLDSPPGVGPGGRSGAPGPADGRRAAPGATPSPDPDPPTAQGPNRLAHPAIAGTERIAPRAGTPFEGTFSGASCHAFDLDVGAGAYVEMELAQLGVDVAVTVRGPAGGGAMRFDSPVGADGAEGVAFVAAEGGEHGVRICAQGEPRPGARYSVRLQRPRKPDRGDRARAQGHRLYARAQEHYRAERRDDAGRGFREALELWRRAEYRHGEAWCHFKLGRLAGVIGDPESAADHFRRAARIHGELGQEARQAAVSSYLAHALDQRGWSHSAAEAYERTAELARRAGKQALHWEAVLGLAYRLQEQGRTLKALRAYRRLEEHYRERGSAAQQFEAVSHAGKVYRESGDPLHALESFGEALRLARRADLPGKEAEALEDIGRAQLDLKRHGLAARSFETALSIRRSLPGSPGLAVTLNNLGRVRRVLGQVETARASFEEALGHARAAGRRELEAQIRLNLARLAGDRGEPRSALEQCREAVTLVEDDGRLLSRADALHCIARQQAALGRHEAALEAIGASVRALEALRSRSAVQGLRAGFLAGERRHFELHVELLLAQAARDGEAGTVERAFTVAEQIRMRTLRDGFAEAEARVRANAAPELLDREEDLLAEVEAVEAGLLRLRSEHGSGEPQGIGALAERLAGLDRELDLVRGELLAGHPGWRALLDSPPATVTEVQERLLAGGDTQILAYLLGAERSHAWVIGRDRVAVRELPGRDRIEALVRRAAELLARSDQRHLRGQASLAAAELADAVLAPVADLLDARRIALVKDGALHHVPFAPLPLPGRRVGERPMFGERHETVELPSATATLALGRLRAGSGPYSGELAILADPVFHEDDPRLSGGRQSRGRRGDEGEDAGSPAPAPAAGGPDEFPRLAGTALEARAMADLLPRGEVLLALGPEADRRLVTGGALYGHRILHFATHAVADPVFTGLVLSRFDAGGRPVDGVLRVHQIDRLRLRAELVTLSACRTAMGDELPGEGLLGLSRAFLSAGASRVLASFWPVDDRATAELMTRFYRHLLVEGQPASRALQLAQGSLRRSAEWSAPHYWGAFVLQGDWR